MDHHHDHQLPHGIRPGAKAMLAMSRDSLLALRAALFRDLGIGAATYLQEAGYTGAGPMYEAFAHWLAAHGLGTPDEIVAADFDANASAFFADTGWGSLTLGSLGQGIATIDSTNWAEADPAHALEFPACYYTTGVFADFFGRLADGPVAVMEVECRSMGSERCRFLVGSGEVMQRIYDEIGRGVAYEQAVSGDVQLPAVT
jgi:uncharacterized protein